MSQLRELFPERLFLVPGVGTQGGALAAAVRAGIDARGKGMIINASRAILLADSGHDGREHYLDAVRGAAQNLRDEINKWR